MGRKILPGKHRRVWNEEENEHCVNNFMAFGLNGNDWTKRTRRGNIVTKNRREGNLKDDKT